MTLNCLLELGGILPDQLVCPDTQVPGLEEDTTRLTGSMVRTSCNGQAVFSYGPSFLAPQGICISRIKKVMTVMRSQAVIHH